MLIEFQCPACQQPLRVPQEVAGQQGKCPQCARLFVIPSTSTVPAGDAGSRANPFADGPATNAYDVGGIPARHYPELGPRQQFSSDVPVIPQRADATVIFSLSLALWQRHLGLLVGTTLIGLVLTGLLVILQTVALTALLDEWEGLTFHLVRDGLQLMNLVVQTYFWIGEVQICLKLARNQPAEFADLFGGGDRFLPVLGAWLLLMAPWYVLDYGVLFLLSWDNGFGEVDFGVMAAYISLSFMLTVVGAILVWPFWYLVLDRKAGMVESFIVALHVTEGNRVTSFLLMLLTLLLLIAGYVTCLVGLVFTVPLVFVLWSTAYLMMAGQIPVYNWLHQHSVYR